MTNHMFMQKTHLYVNILQSFLFLERTGLFDFDSFFTIELQYLSSREDFVL